MTASTRLSRIGIVSLSIALGLSLYLYHGHAQVVLPAQAVRPGAAWSRPTGHYGLLRTIETAWGLPLLGRSARAAPITGVWR